MSRKGLLPILFSLLCSFVTSPATAGVPETMNYQGVLTDGGGSFVPDGNYNLVFALYSVSSGGVPIWSETHPSVPVSLGAFHVVLGSSIPLTIPFDKPYWLGISVNGGSELVPRVELTSVAYSLETKALCLPYDDSGDSGPGALFKLTNTSADPSAWGLFVDKPNSSGNSYAIVGRIQQSDSFGSSILGVVEGGGNGSIGVEGISPNGVGVRGFSTNLVGIQAVSGDGTGLQASSNDGNGIEATTSSTTLNYAVFGSVNTNSPHSGASGVYGVISSATAIGGYGVFGENNGAGNGVRGLCNDGTGVRGESSNGIGVYGISANGTAGLFSGDVDVQGTLTKTAGAFRIDHPLDPENRYLSHSFVESPDMMNIYNGNATLDESGQVWVEMPEWFEALNREFRYQLTAIGEPAPGLFVASEMDGGKFQIAGGSPGLKVSWQVTGIRQDAAAEHHRIAVESEKSPQDRGRYLNPEAFGKPLELSIGWPGPGQFEDELASAAGEE